MVFAISSFQGKILLAPIQHRSAGKDCSKVIFLR